MVVISLIKEYIFAVRSQHFICIFLERTVRRNTMFTTQSLPELRAYLVATLTHLQRNYLPRHGRTTWWSASSRRVAARYSFYVTCICHVV